MNPPPFPSHTSLHACPYFKQKEKVGVFSVETKLFFIPPSVLLLMKDKLGERKKPKKPLETHSIFFIETLIIFP